MERLNVKREDVEKSLANADVYEGSTNKLMELQVRLGVIKNELATTEENWLRMSADLEKAN